MVVTVTQVTEVVQRRLLHRSRNRDHRSPLIQPVGLRRLDDGLRVTNLLVIPVDGLLGTLDAVGDQLRRIRLVSGHCSGRRHGARTLIKHGSHGGAGGNATDERQTSDT
jgi:hypothetical protein